MAASSAYGRVIGVSWLEDRQKLVSELLGEGGEGQAVHDHGEGVALCDALSAVKRVRAGAVVPPEYERRQMLIAIEDEACSGRPQVPHGPKSYLAAELLEAVPGVDKEDHERVIAIVGAIGICHPVLGKGRAGIISWGGGLRLRQYAFGPASVCLWAGRGEPD
jgi:hypothetical protein